jgi:hypothetical protein
MRLETRFMVNLLNATRLFAVRNVDLRTAQRVYGKAEENLIRASGSFDVAEIEKLPLGLGFARRTDVGN